MTLEEKADKFLEQFEEYMTVEKRMIITPEDVRTAWARGYQDALDDITRKNFCNMRQVYGWMHDMTTDEPSDIEPIDGREL